MKLTVLGSGTAAPRLDRNTPSYLLEIGNKKLLFDSGPGTIRQLLKLKVNLLDIDHIFYSHLHNDHISDLPAIIWSNNYGTFRKKPLNIYGPKGFKKYFKILLIKILKPKKLIYKINVKELKDQSIIKLPINKNSNKNKPIKNNFVKMSEFSKKNSEHAQKLKVFDIKIKKVKHVGECIGYRIEHKNKVLVYSGDVAYCNSIIELANNADLLLLDCAYPDRMPNSNHLTPSQCGKIAAKSDAKKLVLTHFYPECDRVDVIKQCRKTFDGNIIKAKDFLRIEI